MAEEREAVLRLMEPRDLQWFYPEEAAQKLRDLLLFATRGARLKEPRPIPPQHRLDIVGRLVRETILGGPPEELPERYARLKRSDREFLIRFVFEALAELRLLQGQSPGVPLGLPREPLDAWVNLLDRGWFPMPPNWKRVDQS